MLILGMEGQWIDKKVWIDVWDREYVKESKHEKEHAP